MMSDPEKWEEIFKYTIDQTVTGSGTERADVESGFRVQFQEEDRSGSRSYDPGGSHMAGKHLQRHWPEPV